MSICEKAMESDLTFFRRFPEREYRARRPFPGEVEEAMAAATGKKPEEPYYIALCIKIPPDSVAVSYQPSPQPCPPEGLPDNVVRFMMLTTILKSQGMPILEAIWEAAMITGFKP